jgi:hypothetical protein
MLSRQPFFFAQWQIIDEQKKEKCQSCIEHIQATSIITKPLKTGSKQTARMKQLRPSASVHLHQPMHEILHCVQEDRVRS